MTNIHGPNDSTSRKELLHLLAGIGAGLGGLFLAGVVLWLGGTPLGALAGRFLNWLFQPASTQAMWYVTRSAGIIAYLLLWLSTAWGLALSSKLLDGILRGNITFDFHQFLSLLAIGFTILHVAVLLADAYLPFSLAQVLVPFTATYRPLWTGIGVIGLYLTLLVSVTFYLRKRIGQKIFRTIHYASLLAYLGVTVHGLFAGTDSPLLSVQVMYAGTFLVVVFLLVYRILMARSRATLQPAAVRVLVANRALQARSRSNSR